MFSTRLRGLFSCIAVMSCSGLFAPDSAMGQSLPEIELLQGTINAKYLPYGKKFILKGSALLSTDTADVLHMTISFKDKEVFSTVWLRKFKSNETEFRIVVDKPLDFNKEYTIKLSFYSQASLGDQSMKTIINSVKAKALSAAKARTFTGNDLGNFVKEAIDGLSKNNPKFGYITIEGREVTFHKGAAVSYPGATAPGWEELVATYALLATDVEKNEKNLVDAQRSINILSSDDVFEELISSLKKESETNAKLRYNVIDVANLRSLLALPKGTNPFQRLIKDINDKFLIFADVKLKKRLLDLQEAFIDYTQAAEALDTLKSSLSQAQQKVDAIDAKIQDGVVAAGTAFLTDRTFVSKSELESIRIGTTFGFAYTALAFQKDEQEKKSLTSDLFLYGGLKFFFGPVDKELPNPYLSSRTFWNRTALSFGMALSDIDFKGQILQNAAGMKPLLGFSYDASRYITIDLGGVFFKQQSISPERNRKKLHVRPFIGLSFDVDVFNRIRKITLPSN